MSGGPVRQPYMPELSLSPSQGSLNSASRESITVTSSLIKISTDQLGHRAMVSGEVVTPPPPSPLSTAGFSDRYFKTT
jgi:hypothetical protein